MAINLKLAPIWATDPKDEPWGRAWVGWDPTMSDEEIWESNRGIWSLSLTRLTTERFATMSTDGVIRLVAELEGHDIVYDHRVGKDRVALIGTLLQPGDPVRDALVGQTVDQHRNPVSYIDTSVYDEITTAERAVPPAPADGAFLLTNNPAVWEIDPSTYADWMQKTAEGGTVTFRWSTGHRSGGIEIGDRVFLLIQGSGPRGIIGSGYASSQVFQESHFDESRTGELAHYIFAEWDHLIAPDDALPTSELRTVLPRQHWNTQASGIAIRPEVLPELERLWAQHLGEPETRTKARGRSQGWQLDPIRRKKVEDAAQARLAALYEAAGWTVEDHRYGHSYDVFATKAGEVLYLEAKGTETAGNAVLVSKGEVEHARKFAGRCVMGVLSEVKFLPNGEVDAESGIFQLYEWNPDAGSLVPERFSFAPGISIPVPEPEA
ncbi:protein NO VEIN domain-containing protein [Oryzihumus leptocrescens]|uniref:Protein NO VEIN C-terminal domain-containing protein n=1 Tax=Oryzihumus leptocrescens TaxID=297536 RepID=A0A542ZKS7_9MICO|nr:DUF3883 domain-containing protein [Oryzihumus leptocrescens]TQL60962.1 hypothetical protein FB474_2365 [Oryzihumus leptocrescens]